MRRQDFHYDLPDSLIAREPAKERCASRLLSLEGESGKLTHGHFSDLLDRVLPGDLMVFNDTRVIPARLYGRKATGGKLEILVERILAPDLVLAQIRSSKAPRSGAELILDGGVRLQVGERRGAFFTLHFPNGLSALEVLDEIGHIPLPPYIDRPDEPADRERYQTVYGRRQGAVAAPTAGLHFDANMLAQLEKKGVELAFVTLHVGAGTFQPMRAESVLAHRMHAEFMELQETVCQQFAQTRARGGRVIAVGTTSVRCLETAAEAGKLRPWQGETDIFIYPGYRYQIVDALITNFHLPESTLLMLVSAFAGYRSVMHAYREAIANQYRFFSYGDAMFITKNPAAPKEGVRMEGIEGDGRNP